MTTFAPALAALARALEHVGVAWFVGGSIAAVAHGEIRTTMDADVVVDLHVADVSVLARALDPDFFVDVEFLDETVRLGGSCNVVHRDTGFKVDLFVLRRRAFSRVELERRQRIEVLPGLVVWVATAEDCVLTKLEWYEKGGRVSDRQWRDIVGIIKLQKGALDHEHLARWSRELGVSELLRRACEDSGTP